MAGAHAANTASSTTPTLPSSLAWLHTPGHYRDCPRLPTVGLREGSRDGLLELVAQPGDPDPHATGLSTSVAVRTFVGFADHDWPGCGRVVRHAPATVASLAHVPQLYLRFPSHGW